MSFAIDLICRRFTGASSGGDIPPQVTHGTLTLNGLSQDQLVFDTGAAFGRNQGHVPISGTGTAHMTVEARFVDADSGNAATGWQTVATIANDGTWSGQVSGAKHSDWLRVETRLAENVSVGAAMGETCALGHVMAFMGQSEIDRLFVTGGGGYTGVLSNPDQVQIVVGTPSFAGNGQPGNPVTGHTITRGFISTQGLSPKLQHAADMIQKATGDKIMIVDLALSASGLFMLTDDGNTRRRWSDFEDLLNAAGWSDGVRPGVLVHSWAATDSSYANDFIKMIRPAFSGYDETGGIYGVGTPYELELFGSGSTETHQHDHLLFDLTGQGRGKFDVAETKVALCLHRFDAYDDMDNAVISASAGRDDDMLSKEVMRAAHREILTDPVLSQVFVQGTEPMNYENGSLNGGSGIWIDHIHPGQEADGLQQFVRHLTHAGLRALDLVPDTVPEFDTVTYDPAGFYVDFAWSGGAVTTTRKLRGLSDLDSSQPHWTDVFGFEFNGQPVERAELQGDGSVRVHVPSSHAPANWARDRMFFARGGGTGVLTAQADPLNQGWLNYPVADADGEGVLGLYDDQVQSSGGIAIRPFIPDTVGVPAPYLAAAVYAKGGSLTDTQSIQSAAGGSDATQLRVEMRCALTRLTDMDDLVRVGTRFSLGINRQLQARVSFWAGGGVAVSSGVAIVPRVRHDITLTADMVSNICEVMIDGQTVISHTITGNNNRFIHGDRLQLFGKPDTEMEFEFARIWINDLGGGGTPYKTFTGSAGPSALSSDPWWDGSGTVAAL